MTKSTITREQLLEIIETDHVQCGEASYLARMALAAMDSEPVALKPELAKVIYHFRDWNEGFPVERFKADYVISWMLANYPPAQPAPLVPDGYVMVPKEPTKEMINAGWLYYMGTKNPSSKGTYKAVLAAATQEVKP